MLLFQEERQRARERFGPLVRDRRIQRYVDLQPLRSRGFWEALQAERIEYLFQPEADLAALHDIRRSPWIEIEGERRGPVDGPRAVQECVQLEIRKIRGPDQRRQIVHDTIVDRAAFRLGDPG